MGASARQLTVSEHSDSTPAHTTWQLLGKTLPTCRLEVYLWSNHNLSSTTYLCSLSPVGGPLTTEFTSTCLVCTRHLWE